MLIPWWVIGPVAGGLFAVVWLVDWLCCRRGLRADAARWRAAYEQAERNKARAQQGLDLAEARAADLEAQLVAEKREIRWVAAPEEREMRFDFRAGYHVDLEHKIVAVPGGPGAEVAAACRVERDNALSRLARLKLAIADYATNGRLSDPLRQELADAHLAGLREKVARAVPSAVNRCAKHNADLALRCLVCDGEYAARRRVEEEAIRAATWGPVGMRRVGKVDFQEVVGDGARVTLGVAVERGAGFPLFPCRLDVRADGVLSVLAE